MEHKNKIPASVFILTRNSEAVIGRALESVKDFADIVVCDGESHDKTLAIARKYGARIFTQPPECLLDGRIGDFSCVRNECLAHTAFNWVLYIDSDEMASSELVSEIRNIAEQHEPQHLVYQVPISYQRADGRRILYSSNYPGYQTRFFNKKSDAYFDRPVHEKIRFRKDMRVGTLKNPWINFLPEKGFWRDYWDSNKKFMAMAVVSSRAVPRRERWRRSYNAFRSAGGILLKSFRNYLLHGFRDTMPISMEAARFTYHVLLGFRLLLCIF